MRLEGQQIGRYYFRQFIETGGTGTVYLAEDPRIQQQVAIKVIQIGDLTFSSVDQGNNLARFRQEAAAIANLNHPHIVHLNDYNEAEVAGTKIIYIVYPFYKAGSLVTWLRERGFSSLSLQDIADIVRQAADALQYTHQHHIIHQDVKPSNFLIDNEENLKRPNLLLTDFGISKFSDAATYTGTSPSLGTLTYMAPEQINGRPTYASDQYALAVMTYELLTGRPPFQGPPQVVMNQHFNAQPQPPSALNPGIPKAIDRVILRALAKRPEDRFDSVAAFAKAFQQGLQRSDAFPQPPPRGYVPINVAPEISIPPPPPPAYPSPLPSLPPSTPQRRGPNAGIIIGVGLLLLVLIGAGLFALLQRVGSISSPGPLSPTAASSPATTSNTTPNPYLPNTGMLVLDDPMHDNSKGYKWDDATIANAGTCGFTAGAYHIHSFQTGLSCVPEASNLIFSNVAFEVKLRITQGDIAAIVLRLNQTNGTGYYFYINTRGQYSLLRGGSNQKVLASGSNNAINKGENQSNLLALVANGSTISAYVNNQFVTSMDDNADTQGQIGIVSTSSSGAGDVIASDARVWKL